MDAVMLALWAEEVGREIADRTIAGCATFGGPWRAALTLAGAGVGDLWLTVSLERLHPTLFLERHPPRGTGGGLPAALADAIAGARLGPPEVVPGERIIRIPNDRGVLVVELLRRGPSLVACDACGRIVAAHGGESVRLAAGAPYRTPESPPELPHPGIDRRIAEAIGAGREASWPALLERARALARRTTTARAEGAEARPETDASGPFRVYVAGGRHIVSPVPLGTAESSATEPIAVESSANAAARAAFLLELRAVRHAESDRSLAGRIRALRKRLERLRQAVERDLEHAERWPELERRGSALLARPDLVRRGLEEVRLPDPFDPDGPPLGVAVDPRLSPAENAATYLKRATRGKRSVDLVRRRLDAVRADIVWLTERADRPRAGWTEGDLERLEALVARHRVPGGDERARRPVTKRPETRSGVGFHPRRYRSSDGWTILVGRTNAENDWLTHRFAKPQDIWLHAQGVAGSHVILRREGRKDNPSRRTLEEAASLAAHHSKARHSEKVPVIYTERKYVWKPRRAAPGIAACTREKTLMASPADAEKIPRADEAPLDAGSLAGRAVARGERAASEMPRGEVGDE